FFRLHAPHVSTAPGGTTRGQQSDGAWVLAAATACEVKRRGYADEVGVLRVLGRLAATSSDWVRLLRQMLFMHVPLAALHQNLFASVNGFALLAIPFFIYAGELMGRGSVAQRPVDFVQGGVGSIRGSLGVTAVGTSAIFGAISG